jgi:alkanesulfonate monooxygenase SsuD/methylene tetrahydromethanopterin reductase-like flavin-dependent oxidoreductase (luciferase family)
VRALLAGAEVDYALNGETHPIRFQMREHRFINLDDPIKVYVAGFGPKAQALAGALGDGLVSDIRHGGPVAGMLANARAGAARAGRALGPDFYIAADAQVIVQQPGEPLTSERIISECGASVITGLHRLVSRYLENGEEPPDYARPSWKAYLSWLEQYPPESRHQRLHASHFSFLDPEEARFITPELIKAHCIAGEPQEVGEALRELERQGLNQVILYPPLKKQYRVIEDFADQVMSRM